MHPVLNAWCQCHCWEVMGMEGPDLFNALCHQYATKWAKRRWAWRRKSRQPYVCVCVGGVNSWREDRVLNFLLLGCCKVSSLSCGLLLHHRTAATEQASRGLRSIIRMNASSFKPICSVIITVTKSNEYSVCEWKECIQSHLRMIIPGDKLLS